MIEENKLNVDEIVSSINKDKISKEDVEEYLEKSKVKSQKSKVNEEQLSNL